MILVNAYVDERRAPSTASHLLASQLRATVQAALPKLSLVYGDVVVVVTTATLSGGATDVVVNVSIDDDPIMPVTLDDLAVAVQNILDLVSDTAALPKSCIVKVRAYAVNSISSTVRRAASSAHSQPKGE